LEVPLVRAGLFCFFPKDLHCENFVTKKIAIIDKMKWTAKPLLSTRNPEMMKFLLIGFIKSPELLISGKKTARSDQGRGCQVV
jgi:hypothetical protein